MILFDVDEIVADDKIDGVVAVIYKFCVHFSEI